MKIALCFVISYDHKLNKEHLWREWIEPNKDIINVYIYYKDLKKIKSSWILQHALPPNYIHETSYYHVIPAYLSLMQYALRYDNQWFCLLTDSCCPIISPHKFRSLFYELWNRSIISWKPAWWNIHIHKRANLELLPQDFRLANDPWFTMKREHVEKILHFTKKNNDIVKTICNGGLANESLFAIILQSYKQLKTNHVINGITHITDWTRMDSATSPHTFKDANSNDIQFIEENLKKNKYAMFIRKVSPDFPDEILRKHIFKKEDHLIFCEPFFFICRRWILCICNVFYYGLPIIFMLYTLKNMFLI
jgi:hypothetical protein